MPSTIISSTRRVRSNSSGDNRVRTLSLLFLFSLSTLARVEKIIVNSYCQENSKKVLHIAEFSKEISELINLIHKT